MKSVELVSFQYFKQNDQPMSDLFKFADEFTIFHAHNGAGKTPIMDGIAFALGYSAELPPFVSQLMSHVTLNLKVDKKPVEIVRYYKDKFHSVVKVENKPFYFNGSKFQANTDFNKFMFNLFGLEIRGVSTTGRTLADRSVTYLYMSQLIPCFYISQGTGWMEPYIALQKESYVKDIDSEVYRLLLGIRALHPMTDNDYKDKLLRKKELLETEIKILKDEISTYKSKLAKNIILEITEIERKMNQAETNIHTLKDVLAGTEDKESILNNKIQELNNEIKSKEKAAYQFKLKITNLKSLAVDISQKTEIEEDAFKAELAFVKFCGIPECNLFFDKKTPFAKKVMYLNDQFKDIQKSIQYNEIKREELSKEIKEDKERLKSLLESEIQTLSNKEQLVDLQRNIDEFAYYSEVFHYRINYNEKLEELNQKNKDSEENQSNIDLLKKGNNKLSVQETAKKDFLEHSFKRWVNVLRTPNMKLNKIEVNNEFRPLINEKVIKRDSSFAGSSTGNRIILAFKTALLETSMKYNCNFPNWIMIDTPRKDETDIGDLEKYFDELRQLKNLYNKPLKVVLAYKDKVISPQNDDIVYSPRFETDEGLRYFAE